MTIAITILGIIQLARGKASTAFREPLFHGTSSTPSSWSLALYSGLWAFDGWDQANYVGGEMSHPEKNIPKAIHSSMAIVTVGPQAISVTPTPNISYAVDLHVGKCRIFCCP
ncbi:hypothetical protein H0H87_002449 [Tephrocybe sp. NHM501043]|nr:hypothetical protein H0H87_002449 [Tephrocybe sp. NHM501043]